MPYFCSIFDITNKMRFKRQASLTVKSTTASKGRNLLPYFCRIFNTTNKMRFERQVALTVKSTTASKGT